MNKPRLTDDKAIDMTALSEQLAALSKLHAASMEGVTNESANLKQLRGTAGAIARLAEQLLDAVTHATAQLLDGGGR